MPPGDDGDLVRRDHRQRFILHQRLSAGGARLGDAGGDEHAVRFDLQHPGGRQFAGSGAVAAVLEQKTEAGDRRFRRLETGEPGLCQPVAVAGARGLAHRRDQQGHMHGGRTGDQRRDRDLVIVAGRRVHHQNAADLRRG
jgi:hypothetical protein